MLSDLNRLAEAHRQVVPISRENFARLSGDPRLHSGEYNRELVREYCGIEPPLLGGVNLVVTDAPPLSPAPCVMGQTDSSGTGEERHSP